MFNMSIAKITFMSLKISKTKNKSEGSVSIQISENVSNSIFFYRTENKRNFTAEAVRVEANLPGTSDAWAIFL